MRLRRKKVYRVTLSIDGIRIGVGNISPIKGKRGEFRFDPTIEGLDTWHPYLCMASLIRVDYYKL